MRVSTRAVFVLALPLLLGVRDPFQPLEDPCAATALSRWHYHGAIVSLGRKIGLLRDAGGGWLRVQVNTQLPGGGLVLQLTEQELLVAMGSGCDPASRRWLREGMKNEKNVFFTGDRAAPAALPDGKNASGVLDGRRRSRRSGFTIAGGYRGL